MDDIRKGKVYGALFAFFIVLLIVGGYFVTVKLTKHDDTPKKEEKVVEKQDLKVKKEKDAIYLENADTISEKYNIAYQNVIINLNSDDALDITSKLNNETSALKQSLKKISEQELSEEEEAKILYKEDDIYEAKYQKYTRYFYKNYASLLVEDYTFTCFDGEIATKNESYVFDIETGKLITKEELLNKNNKTLEDIKVLVKEQLDKKQEIVNEEEVINIPETIKNLEDGNNFGLFVNKSGFLTLSYLVKTKQNDYNDVIILN